MRLRPALFAVPMAVCTVGWFAVPAQEQTPAAANGILVDPNDAVAAAAGISARSGHLKSVLDEVHPADWVAKGAPQTYIAQWNSLTAQNRAIADEMNAIAQHLNAFQADAKQEGSLEPLLKALFRVHRFDGDLDGLLSAVRRYQNPALADLIESVAANDQTGIGKLQEYALDRANEKDRQLDLVDKEAQRCRAMLANQPVAHPSTSRKTSK